MATTTFGQPSAANYIDQLTAAFRQYGTRWYEADDSYDLTSPESVEALLVKSLQFNARSDANDQVRAKSAIIARAAIESGNRKWVGHPDNDPLDSLLVMRELSALIQAVLECGSDLPASPG